MKLRTTLLSASPGLQAGGDCLQRERFEKSGSDPYWLKMGIPLYVTSGGSIVKGEVGRSN